MHYPLSPWGETGAFLHTTACDCCTWMVAEGCNRPGDDRRQ